MRDDGDQTPQPEQTEPELDSSPDPTTPAGARISTEQPPTSEGNRRAGPMMVAGPVAVIALMIGALTVIRSTAARQAGRPTDGALESKSHDEADEAGSGRPSTPIEARPPLRQRLTGISKGRGIAPARDPLGTRFLFNGGENPAPRAFWRKRANDDDRQTHRTEKGSRGPTSGRVHHWRRGGGHPSAGRSCANGAGPVPARLLTASADQALAIATHAKAPDHW